jgi:hypothetical protein
MDFDGDRTHCDDPSGPPQPNLAAAERFYVQGLGLQVLYRAAAESADEHELVMVGLAACLMASGTGRRAGPHPFTRIHD